MREVGGAGAFATFPALCALRLSLGTSFMFHMGFIVESLFHLAVLCDSLRCGAYGTFFARAYHEI